MCSPSISCRGARPSLLWDSPQAFPPWVMAYGELRDSELPARNGCSVDGCSPSREISCRGIEPSRLPAVLRYSKCPPRREGCVGFRTSPSKCTCSVTFPLGRRNADKQREPGCWENGAKWVRSGSQPCPPPWLSPEKCRSCHQPCGRRPQWNSARVSCVQTVAQLSHATLPVVGRRDKT